MKAIKAKIEQEERHFDFAVLESAVQNAQYLDIRQIAEQTEKEVVAVDTVAVLSAQDVILDIRSPEETDEKPLNMENVQLMPFYKLSSQFANLDQSKNYLLYCERGVMSKLQALYLKEQGFSNVKVFRQ